MDLKVKDVANLLNVKVSVIEQFIKEGKIPAYRLNNEFRFDHLEIEDWILHEKLQSNPSAKDKEMHFMLYKALVRGDVLTHEGNTSKEIVIKDTMQTIAARYDLDAQVLSELFLDREKLMPTALEKGIGIPHTRDFLLDTHYDIVIPLYLKHPIEYGALDKEKVHTLFFLFACNDKNHLNVVSKVAFFCSHQEHRDFLKKQPLKRELLGFIQKWEASI